ncbi:caspase family protein [Blastococcus sp. BMG 814]|uniref:Caspase family protein n=1 Tax=Blastococcus carthaginiensis TaxID=3050034 RepID=A0ABT9IEN2_9ACTN|nr:caspase family protein [Blastococcus carthaginiensis]MDP5184040.1 caspase family protein [Blastococcus carthaginiensis]
MKRAAVLIGVRQAGRLPRLQAVGAALELMAVWARSQGMDPVTTLSDEKGHPVDTRSVYAAIDAVVSRETVDQLVVYFAGHGINNGHSEYWLLSESPENPNEAVNVAGSAVLAERCGVPHVVLVSDACRTAPDSIHALAVTGGQVFRNRMPSSDGGGCVDQFYACRLGDPAFEFRDPEAASRTYRSLYTEVLAEALTGRHPGLVAADPGGDGTGIVRPWQLKRGLGPLVTDRLTSHGLGLMLSQSPDARLTSDPETAWLSRVKLQRKLGPPSLRDPGDVAPDRPVEKAGVDDLAVAASRLIGRLTVGELILTEVTDQLLATGAPGADVLRHAALGLAHDPGPRRLAAPAALAVRGSAVVEAMSPHGATEILGGAFVRVFPASESVAAVEVAVQLADGSCTLVPAFRDRIGTLQMRDGQLADVAYEPMEGSPAQLDAGQRSRLRAVRAVVAAASRFGVLDLAGPEGPLLAEVVAETADVSLAVYVAYGLQDAGRGQLVDRVRTVVAQRTGTSVFDLELLAQRPPRATTPGLPLLSRGWPLNVTHSPDPVFQKYEAMNRVPSLWTLFARGEWDRLRRTLAEGGSA